MTARARAQLQHHTCRGCGVTFIGILAPQRYSNHSWRCRPELERVGLIGLADRGLA